jgi:DMSO/TMAO reductase YedYZ molybdopterin-dependent catalytic subunit
MDAKQRIVAARMRLKERFERRMSASPSVADPRPMGSGPQNRHGMPRLPAGQYETNKWPVLDLGMHPEIPLERWQLLVDGAVEEPLRLAWADFLELEQVEDTSDFHCVTTWSKLDMRWKGVRLSTVLAAARPKPEAAHLLCHAYDGYTVNIPLEEALKDDVLLVHTYEDEPLPREHGGPVRVITPQLYAWKGAKWIHRLEVLERDKLGFWEERGYSNTAYPWREDRYARAEPEPDPEADGDSGRQAEKGLWGWLTSR